MPRTKRDPRTKEEFLDRMLRYDFDGDIRQVGAQPASVVRIGANALRLTFPDSGVVFDLTVHRPREENKAAKRMSEARSFTASEDSQPEPEPIEEAPRQRRGRQTAPEQGQRRQSN